MVELIVGENGRGKTKYLLDYAAREISKVSGNINFLDKDAEHMYELNNKIRLINMRAYALQSQEEFMGFILGLISQDRDLELIFLDAFLDIARVEAENLSAAVARLEEISREFQVKFVLSLGVNEAALPAALKEKVIVAL